MKVKEFKGHKVPDGATRFLAFDQFIDQPCRHEFYKIVEGKVWYFDYDDKDWFKSTSIANFNKSIPLPEQPEINWNESPSDTAVWIVSFRSGSDWHELSKDGQQYNKVGSERFWTIGDDDDEYFTVHHRPMKEWEPVAGKVCEALFAQVWVSVFFIGNAYEYGVGLENIKTGEIHKVDPEKIKFRPLKTQQEKDREAFIEGAAIVVEKECLPHDFAESEDFMIALSALFKAGYTAPKGEDNEKK
jgi:hypothetical protein